MFGTHKRQFIATTLQQKMYYDRGRHIEQGCEAHRRDYTDQVLHDGDVVSRSDGFGTTATMTPVSRTMSINFWMGRLRLALDHPFCGNSFIRRQSSTTFKVAMFL